MAFGSKTSALRVLIAAASLASLAVAQQDLRLEVRHGHLLGGRTGTLLLNEKGVSYRENATEKEKKKGDQPHAWDWAYDDIQQLELSPQKVRILTYKDTWWKAGADRGYEFDIVAGQQVRHVYDYLRTKLDQRFVADLADASVKPLWEIRVKHLKRFGGTQGLLTVGNDQLVFLADEKNASRTWRFEDIANISTSGPFELSVVTYERALAHYGNLKQFNFQLKEPLDEARYDELWRRLNESKGLQLQITSQDHPRDEKSARHFDAGGSTANPGRERAELHGHND